MRDVKVVTLKTLSISVTGRELALTADQSLWAGNQEECVPIVAQFYGLFDNLELGLEPNLCSSLVAAGAATLIGDKGRASVSSC